MRHVLLAYDGSAPADDALELALERLAPDRLTALYVSDPDDESDTGAGAASSEPAAAERAEEAQVLDVVERRADDATDVQAVYRVGDPAEEVVAYAGSNGVEHVVLGSHGREGMSRLLVGSVAETVVRNSPVPVTVVR